MAIASKPERQPRCRLARHDWPSLKAIVMVESTRESGRKTEFETRFYITSLLLLAPAAPGGTIGTGRPQPLGGGKHALDHGLPG